MVEEVEKSSSVTEEPIMTNNPQADDDDDGEAPEEGEIVSDDDTSSSAKPTAPLAVESHPLEHSWTFWFDNPSAKSKQAAWGSSIRPIYTFSTVEGFWRYIYFIYFCGLICILYLFWSLFGFKGKIREIERKYDWVF
ncbi:hypothetical protein CsSME_00030209 [Camellia sinensis var. sinensis]